MSIPKTLSDGRYELVSTLGEGGMSIVYRAFDHRLQVWRAIKVLSPQFAAKDGVRNRFEAEAQAMALLEHANIVRVYDVGRDGNWPFIVMELVAGGGLVDWIERHGSMPSKLAIDVTLDVCRGVATAHDNGVIHRDIKPQNLLVTREGVVRLADFGIARVAQDVSHTKTGAVMGTLGYMAPEQRTDAKNIDERADVYSIAATLYTLLTNRIPTHLFAADRDVAMMKGIHEELKAVLVKATMYHREERYGSVAELASSLETLREKLPDDPAETPDLYSPDEAEWSRPQTPISAVPGALDTDPFGGQGDTGGIFGSTILPDIDGDSPRSNLANSGHFLDHATLPPDGDEGPSDTFIRERRKKQAVGLQPAYDDPEWPAEVTPRRSSAAWIVVAGVLSGLAGVGMVVWAAQSFVTNTEELVAELPVEVVEPSVATKTAEVAEPEKPPPPVEKKPKKPKRPKPTKVTKATPVVPVVLPPVQQQCLKTVTAPATANVGEAVLFVVKLCVSDATEVTLLYRPVDGGSWQTRLMPPLLGALRTKVSVDERYRNGFEYYIRAGELFHGTQAKPHRIDIL